MLASRPLCLWWIINVGIQFWNVRRVWSVGFTKGMKGGKGSCSWDESEGLCVLGERRAEKVCGQATWFSVTFCLWLSRGCPPDLRTGSQGHLRGGRP